MNLSPQDRDELVRAVALLENPGFIARISNRLGKPIEIGFNLLPVKWAGKITTLTRYAIRKALNLAVLSLDKEFKGKSSDFTHKFLIGTSGAVGGAFGLATLSVELPVSTTLILRSIADIARSEGEDIGAVEGQLACIEVFALGGKGKSDDGSESGYLAVRAALAQQISEAADFIITQGLSEEGAPVLVRFIAEIASRYGIVVSEKAAAQALPVIGAVLGSSINLMFIKHFQDMARGHFIVRRLERQYGRELIRRSYMKIKNTDVSDSLFPVTS